MRPRSIVSFERLYIVSIVLGLIGSLWVATHLGAIPLPADAPPQVAAMVGPIAIAGMAFSLLIGVLLLYFIARRASVVAKWIFVVMFALGVLSLLGNVARGLWLPGAGAVLSLVQLALQVAMIWLLFRPDAAGWFDARRRGVPSDVGDVFR